MKKVLTGNIGGKSFTMDDDAFAKLKNYLDSFKATITDSKEAEEVMEDIEVRVAEILADQLRNEMQTVNSSMVDVVMEQLGTPEGIPAYEEKKTNDKRTKTRRHLYRNVDSRMLGGVCSGIAAYFDADTALVRFIFLASLLIMWAGFWVYLILWIVVPAARTVSEKLEMNGEPATAENIKNAR